MRVREDFILRIHVWLIGAIMPHLVRVRPLKALLPLMTPSRRRRPYAGIACERIVAAVESRFRRSVPGRRRDCLRRGLTLFHFLRLAGAPAVLHIGAYNSERSRRPIRAHCWVSLHGEPVADGPAQPTAVLINHGTDF